MSKVKKLFSEVITNEKLFITFFVFAAFVPTFLVYKSGMPVIKWNDAFTGLFSDNFYYNQAYVWNYAVSSGVSANFYSSILFFEYLMNKFFSFLSLPVYLIQAVQLWMIIFFSFLGVFLLVKDLLQQAEYIKHKQVIAFITALFYLLNFYMLYRVFYRGCFFIFLPLILPYSILFLWKALNSKKVVYIILAAFVPAVSTIMFMSPGYGILIYFSIFIAVLIFYFSLNRERYLKKIIGLYFLFLSLFNFYWILPSLFFLNRAVSNVNKLNSSEAAISAGAQAQGLLESICLIPKKSWMLWKIKGLLNSSIFFKNGIFVILSFIIPIVIFSQMIFIKKCKVSTQRIVIVLFSILALSLFFSKGANPPFAFINSFLISKTLLMRIMAGTDKFPYLTMVLYTALLPFALIIFQKRFKDNIVQRLYLSLFVIIMINSFSFWNGSIFIGNVIWSGARVSSYVEIPESYYLLKQKLNSKRADFKLAFLPLVPFDMPTLKWKFGYLGDDFRRNFFSRAAFSNKSLIPSWDIATHLIDAAITISPKSLNEIVRLLNIKYIVLHHDLDLKLGNYLGQQLIPPYRIEEILAQTGICLVKSFGKLDVYKISEQSFLPHIYSAVGYSFVAGTSDTLIPLCLTKYLKGKPVLLFASQVEMSGGTPCGLPLPDTNIFECGIRLDKYYHNGKEQPEHLCYILQGDNGEFFIN